MGVLLARGAAAPDVSARYHQAVLEKLKKLFKGSSKKSSEKMTQERAAAQEQAEESTPGHSDRAAQIGMFSPH
jgi:hypothetical protein